VGWKMVRDNNQAWCEANGVSGAWRTAGPHEAIRALGRKLAEEALEFMENGDPAELFDVWDALEELLLLSETPALRAAHQAKVAEHGRFHDHVMWSPLPGEPPPAGGQDAAKPGEQAEG